MSTDFADYFSADRVTPCAPLASYAPSRNLPALSASDSGEICEICGSIFHEHKPGSTRSNGAPAGEHGLATRGRITRSFDGTAASLYARGVSDERGARWRD